MVSLRPSCSELNHNLVNVIDNIKTGLDKVIDPFELDSGSVIHIQVDYFVCLQPARIRKKNKFYEEFYEPPTNLKGHREPPARHERHSRPAMLPPPSPMEMESPRIRKINKQKVMHHSFGMRGHPNYPNLEAKIAKANAVRLRNVLKLPKAHKWVFYEWFYSNLDRPLLLSENDFRICLRENFPNIKTRRLTRAHWSLLRRLMGKPRRCSAAFFEEERRSLNDKREKIRTLQSTRSVQLEFLRDLPDDMHVPMPLIIGTRITARVRYPTDGLYTGKVDAIDALRHCYRVTFEKENLGTRSIPDYEVLSIYPQETIPLSAYKTQHKASRNLFMSPARLLAQSALQGKRHHMHHHKYGHAGEMSAADCPMCQQNQNLSTPLKLPSISSGDVAASMGNAALKMGEPTGSGLFLNEADIYGGYPMKFLVMVTKLSKILEVKKRCVDELRELNSDAERKLSVQETISIDFQHAYLTIVVQLERLNKELNQYLAHVLQYANEIAQEHGVSPLEQPMDFKQRCDEDAIEIVTRLKNVQGQRVGMKNMELITKLTGMLVQIRSLSEQNDTASDCSSVLESLRETKSQLHASSLGNFENSVEIKLHHAISGLSQQGNLNSFHYSHPSMQYM
ncbi:Protein lin-9 [Cichlidogyrus casuarinus]|uniref:Protein lin-9 n=1 Tax=Cichlidogyrus casuarinus TaxID=1844966 RepID=A0ABD2Q5J5_9PLAT